MKLFRKTSLQLKLLTAVSVFGVAVSGISTFAWFQINKQDPEGTFVSGSSNMEIQNDQVTGYKIEPPLGANGFRDYSADKVESLSGSTINVDNGNKDGQDREYDLPSEGVGYYLVKKNNVNNTFRYKVGDTSYSTKFSEYTGSTTNAYIETLQLSAGQEIRIREYNFSNSTTIHRQIRIGGVTGNCTYDATTGDVTVTTSGTYRIWLNYTDIDNDPNTITGTLGLEEHPITSENVNVRSLSDTTSSKTNVERKARRNESASTDSSSSLLVRIITSSTSGYSDSNAKTGINIWDNGGDYTSTTSDWLTKSSTNNNWNTITLNGTTDYLYQEITLSNRNWLDAHGITIKRLNPSNGAQWNYCNVPANAGAGLLLPDGGTNSIEVGTSWNGSEFGVGVPGYIYKIRTMYKTSINGSYVQYNCAVYDSNHTYELPTPTAPSGYSFVGWYLDSSCTIPAGTSVTPTEDVILYAKYASGHIGEWIHYSGNYTTSESSSNSGISVSGIAWGGRSRFISPIDLDNETVIELGITDNSSGSRAGLFFFYSDSNSYLGAAYGPNQEANYGSQFAAVNLTFVSQLTSGYDAYMFRATHDENSLSRAYTTSSGNSEIGNTTVAHSSGRRSITYKIGGISNNRVKVEAYLRNSSGTILSNQTVWINKNYFLANSNNETYVYFFGWDCTLDINYDAHSVSFNANGHGTAPSGQTIGYNWFATKPTDPTATGYTFGGWYKESGCTNKWTFDSNTVTANTPLYAKWTANTYTIAYAGMDGATHGNSHPTSGTYDSLVTISNPTKTGYTFAGWTSSAGAGLVTANAKTGTTSSPSTSWSGSATKNQYFKNLRATSGTVTLTATWTVNTYAVTGSAGTGISSIKFASANNITDTSSSSLKDSGTKFNYGSSVYAYIILQEGYNAPTGFSLKSGTANSTGAMYVKDTPITVSTSGNAFETINAVAKTKTVSFNANGGSTTTSKTLTYASSSVTAPTPTRTGYTFAGWNTNASGTGTYTYGTSLTQTEINNIVIRSDTTLYAKWTANTYNIAFDKNNASASGTTTTLTNVSYDSADSAVTLSQNGFSYSGHRLVKWNTEANGSGTDYAKDASLTASQVQALYPGTNGGTRTLYAIWEEVPTYTVTINVNNSTYGSVSSTSIVVPEGTTYSVSNNVITFAGEGSITASTKTVTGYTTAFSSWSSTSGTVNNTMTITANFTATPHTYTLRFRGSSATSGSDPSDITITYGENNAHTFRPNPYTKTGYTFQGWSITEGSTSGTYTAGSNISSSNVATLYPGSDGGVRILYAAWTANTYTIAYAGMSGATHGNSHPTSGTYDSLVTISNPTKTGYTFAGWTATGLEDNAKRGTTLPPSTTWDGTATTNTYFKNLRNGSGTVTLTATWIAKTYTVNNGNGNYGTITVNASGTFDSALTISYNKPSTTGYTYATATLTVYSGTSSSGNVLKTVSNISAAGSATFTMAGTYYDNIYIYINWTRSANTFTIAFNGNTSTDGSTASVTDVTYDEASNTHSLTSNGFNKTGYSFAGWATAANGSVAYSDEQSLTTAQVNALYALVNNGTVTLYAKWTANTFTIAFNGNTSTGGSTASITDVTYDEASNTHSLRSNGFSKTGYSFAGWATAANGSVAYSDGQSLTTAQVNALYALVNNGTVTLYAKWTINSYNLLYTGTNVKSVVFYSDSNRSNEITTSNYGTTIYYTANGDTGYNNKNGSVTLTNGASGVSFASVNTNNSNVTINVGAVTGKTFTVTLSASDATNSYTTSVTVTYGSAMPSIATLPVRPGYDFSGYYSSSDVIYYNGSGTSQRSYDINGNTTLFAVWNAHVFTIAFNGNTSTGGSTASITDVTYDEASNTHSLRSNGFSKTGYSFAGWATAANGSVAYSDGQSLTTAQVNALYPGNSGTRTLYAIWTANTYTITLNLQGGTGGSTEVEVTYGQPMPAITLPTRSSKAFTGYFTEIGGSGTQYYEANGDSSRAWDIASDTTLYANWIDAYYVYLIDAGDGSHWSTAQAYAFGDGERFIDYTNKTTINISGTDYNLYSFAIPNNYPSFLFRNGNWNGYNQTINLSKNEGAGKYYYMAYTWSGGVDDGKRKGVWWSDGSVESVVTIYLYDANDAWDNATHVYANMWIDTGYVPLSASYPESSISTVGGHKLYTFSVKNYFTNIYFNNGSNGGNNQTYDISFNGNTHSGKTFVMYKNYTVASSNNKNSGDWYNSYFDAVVYTMHLYDLGNNWTSSKVYAHVYNNNGDIMDILPSSTSTHKVYNVSPTVSNGYISYSTNNVYTFDIPDYLINVIFFTANSVDTSAPIAQVGPKTNNSTNNGRYFILENGNTLSTDYGSLSSQASATYYYFDSSATKKLGSAPYAYVWASSGATNDNDNYTMFQYQNNSWAGVAMTHYDDWSSDDKESFATEHPNVQTSNVWRIITSASYDKIIFNNGSSSEQTIDEITTNHDGWFFVLTGNSNNGKWTGSWAENVFAVTLKASYFVTDIDGTTQASSLDKYEFELGYTFGIEPYVAPTGYGQNLYEVDNNNGYAYSFARSGVSTWYTDASCETPYSSTAIDNDTVLYAKYVTDIRTGYKTFYVDTSDAHDNNDYYWPGVKCYTSEGGLQVSGKLVANKLYRFTVFVPADSNSYIQLFNSAISWGGDGAQVHDYDDEINKAGVAALVDQATIQYLQHSNIGTHHVSVSCFVKSANSLGIATLQKYENDEWVDTSIILAEGDGANSNDFIYEFGAEIATGSIIRVKKVISDNTTYYGYSSYVASVPFYIGEGTDDGILMQGYSGTARFNIYITHSGKISLAMVPDLGNGYYIMDSGRSSWSDSQTSYKMSNAATPTPEGYTAQYYAKIYFNANDVFKVRSSDWINLNYENGGALSQGHVRVSTDGSENIEVVDSGTYEIYLKIKVGGYDVYINYVGSSDTHSSPSSIDTSFNENCYYVVGASNLSTGSSQRTTVNDGFFGGKKMSMGSKTSATYNGFYARSNEQIYIRSYLDAVDTLYTQSSNGSTTLCGNGNTAVTINTTTGVITFGSEAAGYYNIFVLNGAISIEKFSVGEFFRLNPIDTDNISSKSSIFNQKTAVVLEIPFICNNPYQASISLAMENCPSYVGAILYCSADKLDDPYNTLHDGVESNNNYYKLASYTSGSSISDLASLNVNANDDGLYYAYILVDYLPTLPDAPSPLTYDSATNIGFYLTATQL